MVLEGRLSLREASDRMQVSYRHAKRLKHVVTRDGLRGLIHGNTGRRPANAIGLEFRQKIVKLSRTEYVLFNDTHFTEKLSTVERRFISGLERAIARVAWLQLSMMLPVGVWQRGFFPSSPRRPIYGSCVRC